MPSAISAGNDVNKIASEGKWLEGDDIDSVHSSVSYLAGKGWMNDPVFKPYYHDTGYVVSASSPEAYERIKKKEADPRAVKLETAEDFRKTMPKGVLTGDFLNYTGFWQEKGAGWVHARKAMMSCYNEAKRLGVKYITGSPQGAVISLINSGSDILGAKTADGKEHRADRTILCAGAGANQLLEFKNQLRPTAWTLAHIKMTPEEVKLYKNLPVLFNVEKGFFMEPDEDNHELKMCDEHPGYCNWEPALPGQKWPQSVPVAKHQIPVASERRMRDFLRDIMPQLADRPFCFARVCWCADTRDRGFLISKHPDYTSLVLGSGDAGHGYSMIPAIGGLISDCMEGTMDPRFAKAYRWRPETTQEWWGDELCDRWGAGNKVLDLKKDIAEEGWTDCPQKAAPTSKL
ncbi:hypothetical protein KEM56_001936 [Ascosphaera pollenicola]|nr:hypothetical protein KEM56_001936 [Ascosphaera pollenicola]